MMYLNNKIKEQKGFTLVETLVAVTILLLVMITPMTISTKTAKSTNFSSEQIVAFFLAQEGAELAQKHRDDLALKKFLSTTNPNYSANPWADFLDADSNALNPFYPCFTGSGCGLEINTDVRGTLKTPVNCNPLSNCRLHIDNTSNDRARYTYADTGTTTPFYRVIKMTKTNDDEVQVISEVTWYTEGQRKKQRVAVDTYLNDIYSY